jgi:hypothetical protein
MGLEKDLPPGEALVVCLRPFIEHLALANLSPKTVRQHVDAAPGHSSAGRLDARKHRRKPIVPFKYQLSWRDILWAFAAIALISFTYVALLHRHHMKPEWQDAAFIVMITSVLIAFATRRVFWGNSAF